MAISDDILSSIFKRAGVPDDEAAQHIQALKGMGAQALSAIPGLSSLASAADNTPAMAEAPEGNAALKTVEGDNPDNADLFPNPGNPLIGVGEGVMDMGKPPQNVIPEEDAVTTRNALALTPDSKNDGLDWTKSGGGSTLPPPEEAPETPAVPEGSSGNKKGAAGSETATEGSNPLLQEPSSTEAADREKLHASLDKRQRIGNIIGELGGSFGDAIQNASVPFGGTSAKQDTAEQVRTQLQGRKEEEEGDFEKKLLNDPNSDTSKAAKAMLQRISPDLAKDPSFANMTAQQIKDKMPFFDTFIKAQSAKDLKEMQLKQLALQKQGLAQNQHNSEQDRLEAQAQQRLLTLRGDASLARTELQRDACSSAYTLLEQAKQEGRALTRPEYYDLLGQMWQARTGKAPTDQDIQNLDTKTFKGDLNKAATYFTGKPAGASTQDVYNNLQQFVVHTGQLADRNHEAYMAPHMIKPMNLDDERWQPILHTARGRSFADTVKSLQQNKAGGSSQKIGRFDVQVH